MRRIICSVVLMLFLALIFGCNAKVEVKEDNTHAEATNGLEGTWQLLSGRTIIGKDTTFADYTDGQKMIKIFNGTHFAFLRHDLVKGKQKDPVYSAGGGTYTFEGNKYSEHLEYYIDRNWENNDFHFTVDIRNDSLFQSGLEKIDSLGVNQEILETYVRLKN